MFPSLRKHWFLLLVVLGTLVVVLRPGWLRWTVWLDPSLCGAAAVFLAAWTLETHRIRRALVRPLPAVWAAVISFGPLPGLGWLAGQLLPEPFRIGLLLITSVPCTLASAVIWTRMAGGDEATALLIVFLTNCASWLATTAWLTLGTGIAEVHIDAVPLMARLLLILVVPVGAGQALRVVAFLR